MEDNLLYYKALKEATPMMSQYFEAKEESVDSLLLFRLGDFYELFFEDAKVASSVLNLVLTHRGKTQNGEDIPMCGIPVATIDNYVSRLIKAGYKVAVCEQLEDPKEAKKRGVGPRPEELYSVFVKNAVYETEGYTCSDGTVLDITDFEALKTKKGQNIWKEIHMKLAGKSKGA